MQRIYGRWNRSSDWRICAIVRRSTQTCDSTRTCVTADGWRSQVRTRQGTSRLPVDLDAVGMEAASRIGGRCAPSQMESGTACSAFIAGSGCGKIALNASSVGVARGKRQTGCSRRFSRISGSRTGRHCDRGWSGGVHRTVAAVGMARFYHCGNAAVPPTTRRTHWLIRTRFVMRGPRDVWRRYSNQRSFSEVRVACCQGVQKQL